MCAHHDVLVGSNTYPNRIGSQVCIHWIKQSLACCSASTDGACHIGSCLTWAVECNLCSHGSGSTWAVLHSDLEVVGSISFLCCNIDSIPCNICATSLICTSFVEWFSLQASCTLGATFETNREGNIFCRLDADIYHVRFLSSSFDEVTWYFFYVYIALRYVQCTAYIILWWWGIEQFTFDRSIACTFVFDGNLWQLTCYVEVRHFYLIPCLYASSHWIVGIKSELDSGSRSCNFWLEVFWGNLFSLCAEENLLVAFEFYIHLVSSYHIKVWTFECDDWLVASTDGECTAHNTRTWAVHTYVTCKGSRSSTLVLQRKHHCLIVSHTWQVNLVPVCASVVGCTCPIEGCSRKTVEVFLTWLHRLSRKVNLLVSCKLHVHDFLLAQETNHGITELHRCIATWAKHLGSRTIGKFRSIAQIGLHSYFSFNIGEVVHVEQHIVTFNHTTLFQINFVENSCTCFLFISIDPIKRQWIEQRLSRYRHQGHHGEH